MVERDRLHIVVYRLSHTGEALKTVIHREFTGFDFSVYVEDNTIYVKKGTKCVGKYTLNHFSFSFDVDP